MTDFLYGFVVAGDQAMFAGSSAQDIKPQFVQSSPEESLALVPGSPVIGVKDASGAPFPKPVSVMRANTSSPLDLDLSNPESDLEDTNDETENIYIKKEIDFDDPAGESLESDELPSKRDRKRKAFGDDYDYAPNKKPTARKRSAAKRGPSARGRKASPKAKLAGDTANVEGEETQDPASTEDNQGESSKPTGGKPKKK